MAELGNVWTVLEFALLYKVGVFGKQFTELSMARPLAQEFWVQGGQPQMLSE